MPRTKKPQRIQKPKIFPKDNILNNEKALFEEITVRECKSILLYYIIYSLLISIFYLFSGRA